MPETRRKPKKGEDVLVVLLARGVSHTKAAKAAGVCPQTVSEYLHDAAFRQRIDALRNRFLDSTCGQIIAMGQKAVKTLEKLIDSENDRIALAAVRVWKNCLLDLVNQYDLARQIEELREQRRGGDTAFR